MSLEKNLEKKDSLNDVNQELSELKDGIKDGIDDDWWQKEWSEKKESSFTFKPIALNVWATTLKNWDQWVDWITTTVEFAWWWKNLNMYWYVRKDWNRYAKWFNDWMELFANENLKLWKNFDLNWKQFYWWEWAWKLMIWPRVSVDGRIWSKAEVRASAWGYLTRDLIPWQKNQRSWDSVVDVNFSVKQKDLKDWTWYAFLDISWIKNFDTKSYWTYWEANIKSPNLLDPEKAWALCGMIYARYWWNLKKIELNCAWVGVVYNF